MVIEANSVPRMEIEPTLLCFETHRLSDRRLLMFYRALDDWSFPVTAHLFSSCIRLFFKVSS